MVFVCTFTLFCRSSMYDTPHYHLNTCEKKFFIQMKEYLDKIKLKKFHITSTFLFLELVFEIRNDSDTKNKETRSQKSTMFFLGITNVLTRILNRSGDRSRVTMRGRKGL